MTTAEGNVGGEAAVEVAAVQDQVIVDPSKAQEFQQKAGMGNFLDSDGSLTEEWNKIQQAKAGNQAPAPILDPVAQALSAPAVETPAVVASEAVVPPVTEENVVEHPLFGGKKVLAPEAPTAVTGTEPTSFETIEQASAFFKEKFGVENISEVSDRLSKFTQVETELASSKESVQAFNHLFETMDSDLYKVIEAYSKGEDWRSSLSTPAIDFSKDEKSVDAKMLVEAFSPGKITKEDWEEYNDPDGDATIKRFVDNVIETSRTSFTNAKKQKSESAQQAVQQQQQRNQLYNDSIVKAREHLAKEYSSIDPAALAQIEDVFTKDGVNSLFFEKDGALKADAFEVVAMAKFGKELISKFEKIAMRQAETKVNQEMLSRTPEQIEGNRGSAAATQTSGIRQEVRDMADRMAGMEQRHF